MRKQIIRHFNLMESVTEQNRYLCGLNVQRKLNLQSQELGPEYKCRKKCFERVSEKMRKQIIRHFNLMESVTEQNRYLCGLISVLPIQHRRPRNVEAEANLREVSYSYRVRCAGDGVATEEIVCGNAFLSFHRIQRKKIEYLVSSLKTTGNAPKDKSRSTKCTYQKS
ncbi:hypothetical protein QE152_g24460 [Popillia japonica]|uniref:Uncharacterized protein n=1 Tax=Popillia japonica TaxID=7064 RepID=A0AAW1KF84_POPJA